MKGDEDVCYEGSGSLEDNKFDAVVGALEEILLGESFSKIQKGFCDVHCGESLDCKWADFQLVFSNPFFSFSHFHSATVTFVDSEENKVEYTELFQAYTVIVEKALDDELHRKIPVSVYSINFANLCDHSILDFSYMLIFRSISLL